MNTESIKYAIIDTEANGLFDFSQPADADCQPRLASLCLILVDENLEVEAVHDILVRPDGWEMNPGASAVNGLTTERLTEEGCPVCDVLDLYEGAIDEGRAVVAFNAQYDTKIMRAELRRAGRDDRFESTPNICTMRSLVDICQVPKKSGNGFKFPKLAEACAHFGIESDAFHTAHGDAMACLELLRRMHNLNAIPVPQVFYAKNRPGGAEAAT